MTTAVMARQRHGIVPNAVLAMLLFLFTEVMLFAGLVSGYIVLRSQAGEWPPPGQPRLPVAMTAFNTALLLGSGVLAWRSLAAMRAGRGRRLAGLLSATFVLGLAFVGLQGAEWIALLRHGLTSSSSLYGSLFYTIVGCHALHVVIALAALAFALVHARHGTLAEDGLRAMRLYWTFVVVVWPPLYALVYLW